MCDVLGTSLGGIGLLWVSASIWQMMRGSIIIFSGILSVIFLKRKLLPYRWLGMFIVAAGLCVVGVSSFLESSSNSGGNHYLVLGICLIVTGQFFNAVQMVLEEAFLKKRNFEPLQVVGMEGLWGLILMIAIILPAMYFIPGKNEGSYENSWDAMLMISRNMELLAMIILYWISIAFYNFCGLSVTKKLTAVHRTLIDALRTICVWAIDIFIYYVISETYGEAWTKYSYVQLIGFVLLVIGTMVYNGVIRFPCLRYEEPPPPTPETEPLISPNEKQQNSIN